MIMPKKHMAYSALRLAKQGRLPDKRTRLGAAIAMLEKKILQHFGELNSLQQIELFNLLPLMVFLIQHPITVDGTNKIADDWKWCWTRVENGSKVLTDLGDKKPATDLYEQWKSDFLDMKQESTKKRKR